MNEAQIKLSTALRQAIKGRIGRREFLQLAMASGVSLAAADNLLANARAATPKRGGRFRLGVSDSASTDTLDPATYLNAFAGTAFWGTLSNGLTEIDADGDVVGDIAESFEPSEGARKWMFRIRKGVTFHNGRTVTAQDVLASLQHHRGEASTSGAKASLQEAITIKADGPDTVIFELASGNADFPYVMTDYHLPIMPAREDGTADWSSGVRTGAYKLEKFQPGVQATFSLNADYHKEDRGWFDSVQILAIGDIVYVAQEVSGPWRLMQVPDAEGAFVAIDPQDGAVTALTGGLTARTTALLAGEIDYMDRCDLKTLPLLEGTPGLAIMETTGYGSYVFAMNVTTKPFDDPNVRMALKYSMDREEILNVAFSGHGTIGNDTPIAPPVKFAFDPLPHHTYNPAKARESLKKAGLKGLSVDLSVSDVAFAGALDTALMWREHAKACGINLNVIREPADGYFTNVWRKKPFVATYWFGRPTVDWMMALAFASKAVWNDTSWSDTRFDELLAAARSETDEKQRAGMYAETQQILHDDGGLITVLFNSYVEAHVDNLGHGRVASNVQLDGMRVAERWWFT